MRLVENHFLLIIESFIERTVCFMKNSNSLSIRKHAVGIDVSKDTLEVCSGKKTSSESMNFSTSRCFKNAREGFESLLSWARKQSDQNRPVWFVMEATGVYYEQLAYFLHKAGENVCVLVASRAAHYAKSLPIKSKTDAIDARILSRYGLERHPEMWKPASPRLRKIKALIREREQLQKQHTQLMNRLHAARKAWGHPQTSLERLSDHAKQIGRYLKQISTELDNLWQSNQQLAEPVSRIAGINGIGEQTVLDIIAETDGFALITNRNQLASYSGLDVVLDESGNRQGATKISKHGNAHLRKALYMPAMSAIQHNPALKLFYERLVEKHPNQKMIAVTAVMRKLLLLVYSLWKSGKEYDPEFHYQQIMVKP
ncbi:MAG: IS110 family transposase [Balneolaceae bacterium]|nr:IS110 family transposase [Balneolaceae bacterium]